MQERIAPAAPAKALVVGKATLRAARLLGVPDASLARILGVSAASVSRLRTGKRAIDLDQKEGELALLFLRVYRSLSGLLGDDEGCRKWLAAENIHLRGVPAALLEDVWGLVHVTQYLDAMRGKN